MKWLPSLIVVFAAVILTPGCARDSGESEPATGRTATPESTSTMPTLKPLDGVSALDENSLKALEEKLSCRLPDDYRRFLLANNGGFPSPDCVNFTEDGRKTASDVFCFLAVDEKRPWASLEWNYETYSGRLPGKTLPIARDSCGNLWLLNVREEGAGAVYFWDHGSYETFDETDLGHWPRVATSFREFLGSLNVVDASAGDKVILSRYAFVKQAAEGMARKNAGFSTRGNPEYVWHCDCDDEGKVKLQFVQYAVHATFTHTDGYSRVRAMKGLIEKGQPRLPE